MATDTTTADPTASGRDRRAERILDAAAELLLAWGYRRVTVEEVARRAEVGKGTVYLHFRTKEALMLTVLMRVQLVRIRQAVAAMEADPATILPSRAAKLMYLVLQEDRMLRAILVDDAATLGTLARTAPEIIGTVVQAREKTMDGWFRELRGNGLLRTDSSPAEQRHAYNAVVVGFLTVDPLMPLGTPGVEAKAAMLADTVRLAFETSQADTALNTAAPRVVAHFRSLLTTLEQEIARQKLT